MSSSDPPLLPGFGFSGYRSFNEPGQAFYPMRKVTLLAGQNNAGKSNALRFLRDFVNQSPKEPSPELDRPQSLLPQDWKVRLTLFLSDIELPARVEGNSESLDVLRVADALRTSDELAAPSGVKFDFVLERNSRTIGGRPSHEWLREIGDSSAFTQQLAEKLNLMHAVNMFTGQTYISGDPRRFAQELLAAVTPKLSDLPPVRIIQAFRQIRPQNDPNEGDLGLFDGIGLIDRLQQLESPREVGTARDESRAKYDKINRFIGRILDDTSATFHIPYDASTVQIARGGSVLPLDSLGTGVHQVVMLAAAATLLEGTLVGLEEPEVHLHPLLQRRLVRYLAQETSNQYVIATHSAHLLDYEHAQVFHLTYGPAGTQVAPAGTPHELARVCADLGYRPSDLLQSNAVIWVEGPSDRLYIRAWISDFAPGLIEGIHYSIMFYGGGLLSHLSPEDEKHPGLAAKAHDKAVSDFISLRRLNRHLAIVIDCDKKSPWKRINATKERVRTAFTESDGPGHAWVTDCYTIENYVPRGLLEEAVREVHPKLHLMADEGQWANPLRFEQGDRKPDKVSIAAFVIERWKPEYYKRLGLDKQVVALVRLIHDANGIVPAK